MGKEVGKGKKKRTSEKEKYGENLKKGKIVLGKNIKIEFQVSGNKSLIG